MTKQHDPYLKRDLLKLSCLAVAVAGTLGLFVVTPALSTPTLLSLVGTILLSPWVSAIERRGCSRPLAITLIFLSLGLMTGSFGFWVIRSGLTQWDSFKEHAPFQFHAALYKLREFELHLRMEYPFLSSAQLAESLLNWGRRTGQWFVDHGPSLMGEILTWILIIPFLTFVLLNEGRSIRRGFFQLIPNRYFESFFLITTDISTAISDYLRAKLLEGLLVGLLVTIGLALIKAPYAIVLGVVAGVTNVLPYVGPIFGAIPGILITAFDPTQTKFAFLVALIYFIANLIDAMVIFPIVVAKLINLHPLILIAAVAVGQQYYGLVGMLISIPIATAMKVILQEIFAAVYKQKVRRPGSTLTLSLSQDPQRS